MPALDVLREREPDRVVTLVHPPGRLHDGSHLARRTTVASIEQDPTAPRVLVHPQRDTHLRAGCASWQISPTEDYEGGELQEHDDHNDVLEAPRDLGSLIVFDPMTWHRVTPITSGERWAVVICAYARIEHPGL